MATSVLIIDDHALVRTGLRLLLADAGDIEVAGEAATGEDGLAMARRLRPDVALCDLHLPGISGLEVTARIARGGWGTRVLVVSVLEDGPMPKRLLEAGAGGYVGKNCDAAELVRAVRTVAAGRRYLAGTIAQALALSGVAGAGAGAGTPFDALSARELEVAMLLLRGMRQEDIARRLSLSAKTVNTHKSRLFGKLGIRDSIALARMAGRHGLAEPL
jgi:DNA-binding NarL/FixJ family response regulator